jgi:hypothetical protein
MHAIIVLVNSTQIILAIITGGMVMPSSDVFWLIILRTLYFCFLVLKSCADSECMAAKKPYKPLNFRRCKGGQVFLSYFSYVDSIVLNPLISFYFIYTAPKHLGFFYGLFWLHFMNFMP